MLARKHCKAPKKPQRNKIIPFQQRGTLLSWEGVSEGSVLFSCGTCDMTQHRGESLYNKYVFNDGILVLISGQA